MALRIVSRKRWGSRSVVPPHDNTAKREAFIHHSAGTFGGPPQSIDTFAEQKAVMQAIQRFHIDTRGWSDIAYSAIIFQPYGKLRLARVFRGRGGSAVPAAQLGHNSGTLALCVVDGLRGDKLRLSTRLQIVRVLRKWKREHPGLRSVGGHRDAPGQGTECPGSYIYPALDDIARRSGLRRIKR